MMYHRVIVNYALVFILVDEDLKLKKFCKINTWKIPTRITIAAWIRLRLDIIPKIRKFVRLYLLLDENVIKSVFIHRC